MFLFDIIPNYKSENTEVECKLKLEREKTIDWLKTINGFANAKGGIIYIGVENGSNKLIGFDSEQLDKEKMFFYSQINMHFNIPPTITTDVIDYTIKDSVRYILKIIVSESSSKPIILHYDGLPMIFMRRDGFTNPATSEEIILMATQFGAAKYDSQITDVVFDPNDFTKLYAFYYNFNDGKELKKKDLESIGAIVDNKVTKGLLLFSDNYKDANLLVTCSYYKGFTRGDDEIIASNSSTSNIIDSFYFIYDFIQGRMNHGFIKKTNSRVDVDAYPQRALFEAIINSLAHRDYMISGSQISVDLFRDRLSISSPGSLFQHGDINPTRNISSFISKRRNEMISKILVLCHVMESKGTGFEKIEEEYKDYTTKHKPFIMANNNQFTIVLPDISYPDGIAIESESIRIKKSTSFKSKHDIRILSYCYDSDRNIKDLCDYLDISNSSYFRNTIVSNLVKQGLLLEKETNGTKYYTSNKSFIDVI